jgi:hypothetical protein
MRERKIRMGPRLLYFSVAHFFYLVNMVLFVQSARIALFAAMSYSLAPYPRSIASLPRRRSVKNEKNAPLAPTSTPRPA